MNVAFYREYYVPYCSQHHDLCAENTGLVGGIPSEIGNLINLRAFSLAGTKASGIIPPQLGNVINLRNLNLCKEYFISHITVLIL